MIRGASSLKFQVVRSTLLAHAGALGAAFAFVAALVSVIGWWQGERWRIDHGNLAILNAVYWILILYLLWVLLSRKVPDFLGAPLVKAIHDKKLLIVDEAPWLSLGVLTAIYVKDGEYERLVCTGEVINVQSNNLVQILIREYEDIYSDIEDVGAKLQHTSKDAILIRPGLFRRVGQ